MDHDKCEKKEVSLETWGGLLRERESKLRWIKNILPILVFLTSIIKQRSPRLFQRSFRKEGLLLLNFKRKKETFSLGK